MATAEHSRQAVERSSVPAALPNWSKQRKPFVICTTLMPPTADQGAGVQQSSGGSVATAGLIRLGRPIPILLVSLDARNYGAGPGW